MSAKIVSNRPLILIGAGGYSKVLHSLAIAAGRVIIGVCDPRLYAEGVTCWRGLPVVGGDEQLLSSDPTGVELINGIGQLVGSRARRAIYERFSDAGFSFPALVHPYAWVDGSAQLASGVQIMAGAVVHPDCQVGENTIVNMRASIDHDCVIGAHVHIAPGAILCGGILVGEDVFVGAGATLIQNLIVGQGALIGAGTTVIRNLDPGSRIVGPRIDYCKDLRK